MANQLSNFQFQDNAVRVIAVNGEPWFLAADVCRAIGITSPSKAVKILDDDEVALKTFQGLTKGNEEANFISESGMYKIVMRSQDAIKLGTPAHAFTKWVTSEVLPAIRKTGQYRQQPELDFTDIDAMKAAREIAFKYFDDFRAAVKAGKDSAPMDDIPADVLAGMVSAALRLEQFVLSFDHNGKLCIRPMPNPYDGLAKAIADPGNIGLEDQVILEIGHACMTALACRAKSRKAAIGRTRSRNTPRR